MLYINIIEFIFYKSKINDSKKWKNIWRFHLLKSPIFRFLLILTKKERGNIFMALRGRSSAG